MAGLDCRPLTPDRWDDLLALFGPERGACGGCWCMWFRLRRGDFLAAGRAGRKAAFTALVQGPRPPGLLGYLDGEPVGWVAAAPREEHAVILHSRVTRPVDDRPAWAITCFYLRPKVRHRGLMRPLIDAAVAFAQEQGAELVEAYPSEPQSTERTTGFIGIAKVFREAGFQEIARRTPKRPIMRLTLAPPDTI